MPKSRSTCVRMLMSVIIYLTSLQLSGQISLKTVYAELDSLKKASPSTASVDRIFDISQTLLDSAKYDDLPRLYELALYQSRTLDYHQGEAIALLKLANEYSVLGAYQYAANYSDTLIGKSDIPDTLRKAALVTKGIALSVLSEYDQSVRALEEALSIPHKLSRELDIYDYLSYSYSGQGVYTKAIAYCLEALEVLSEDRPEDFRYLSQFYHNIGLVYLKNEENEKAIAYYRQALDYNIRFQEAGVTNEPMESVTGFAMSKRAPILIESGLVYRNLGLTDSAKATFKQARALAANLGGRNKEIREAVIGINLADLYNDLKLYDSASYELDQISDYFSTGRLQQFPQHVNYLLANGVTLRGQGKLEEALSVLLSAQAKAETLNVEDENTISDLYLSISITYESLGSYQKALEYYQNAQVHRDSIYNAEKARIIKDMETKYLTSEKEREIMAFEKRQEKLKDQLTFAFTGGGLLLIISTLLYRFYKIKRQDNHVLAEKNQEIEKKSKHLQELSNYKEGLTSMIAHDMKNSLNVVIGLSENQPDRQATSQIRQSGQLMLQMVTNMLDIQKFEEAQMKLHMTNISLFQLLDESRLHVETLLTAKSIKLECLANANHFVFGDRDVITRILVNLLINAVKYSYVGGTISVSTKVAQGRLQITVTDTGQGIDQKSLSHIFDKFWQVNPQRAGYAESTGLGLTFCKMAVEAHGGQISAKSKLGEGTTFYFDLALGAPVQSSQNTSLAEKTYVQGATPQEDLEFLQPFIKQIEKLPLYQFGEIQKILKGIEEHSPFVSQWKEKLTQAILNWDQKLYSELLHLKD